MGTKVPRDEFHDLFIPVYKDSINNYTMADGSQLMKVVDSNTLEERPLTTADLTGGGGATGLTDAQLRASPVPVSGAFYQATQPVELPNRVAIGSLAANTTDTVEINSQGCGVVGVTLLGTWTGTVAFQGTYKESPSSASDWFTVQAGTRVTSGTISQSTTVNGNHYIHVAGALKIRVTKTVAGTGTVNVSLTASNDLGLVMAFTQNYNQFLAQTAPSTGSLTSVTGTATSASSQVFAGTSFRKYFLIQNHHATDALWIDFGTAAVAASPSIKVLAGATFTMDGTFASTQAINVIRGGANDISYTAKQGA